jgi:hypothetical protein
MISFVVVTCWKDRNLFFRYLRSVYKHWYSSNLYEIIVIVNDFSDNLSFYKSEAEKIESESSKHISLRWYTVLDILGIENDFVIKKNGWFSQQKIKIIIAEYVDTDIFIIHDSKDFYISPADIDIYIDNGRIKSSLTTIKTLYTDQYKRSYELWGLNLDDSTYILKHWTPVTLFTNIQKSFIKDLKIKLKENFNPLIITDNRVSFNYTEFSLFSAYFEYNKYITTLYDIESFDLPMDQKKDLRELEY